MSPQPTSSAISPTRRLMAKASAKLMRSLQSGGPRYLSPIGSSCGETTKPTKAPWRVRHEISLLQSLILRSGNKRSKTLALLSRRLVGDGVAFAVLSESVMEVPKYDQNRIPPNLIKLFGVDDEKVRRMSES